MAESSNENPVMTVKALPKSVLVHNFKKGERMVRGIILLNDDGKTTGIRARWAQVYSVGDDVHDLKVGEWVYLAHGRWTRGANIGTDDDGNVKYIWKIDYPEGIICVQTDEPCDDAVMDKGY